MFEFIDKVVYINPKHRTVENQEVQFELSKYIPIDKIVRFEPISTRSKILECLGSHVGILGLAITNSWKNFLVVTDNVKWHKFDIGYELLRKMTESEYQVIALGKDTGYLVDRIYYGVLLFYYKQSLIDLANTGNQKKYTVDVCQKYLKGVDNWRLVIPHMIIKTPPVPFDFVEKAVYINLKHRTDRNEKIYYELTRHIPTDKILRFEALKNEFGAIGCTDSHIAVLEMAIANGWDSCLIIEDDGIWRDFNAGYRILEELATYDYDVIMLSSLYSRYSSEYRIRRGVTSVGYLIRNHYFTTLLENFKDSRRLLQESRDIQVHALDKHWEHLQYKDNWYCIRPPLMIQGPSFSDIYNSFIDRTNLY